MRYLLYQSKNERVCHSMKYIFKLHSVLAILMIAVTIIPILISATVITHKDDINKHMLSYIKSDRFKNIHIYDSSGRAIYDGNFSNDDVTRKSMFHIIGDKNGSTPNSLLSVISNTSPTISKFSGYNPCEEKIELTIDMELQKAAYTLLESSGFNGSIVVIDYKTGEVKAMVSTPSVDVLNTESIKDGAFINKATCTYPPGSVFKAVTVAAALESDSDTKNFTYNCHGRQNHIVCYNKIAHGPVNLNIIMEMSCNCAVSIIAKTKLTPTQLNAFTEKSKLTSNDIIADMPIKPGNIDAEKDMMWSANGQSLDMFSPIAIASFYSAIANNGYFNQLKIIKETKTGKATEIMSSDTAYVLTNAMTKLCESAGIRCHAFGKTGTAELNGKPNHAWFVCSLIDDAAPKYTILTFLEHGESSAKAKALTKTFIEEIIIY